MTKKDYVKLAEAIKENTTDPIDRESNEHGINWNSFVNELCDILQDDNPRFDRERFITACQY